MAKQKQALNASKGDPLFPFHALANEAFRKTRDGIHEYRFMNGRQSDPDVTRAIDTFHDYFTSRGLTSPGLCGVSARDVFVTGGGVTQAFATILRLLARDVARENRHKSRAGVNAIRPAILMPMPTYGFFAQAVQAEGFTLIPVPRDPEQNGKLTPVALRRAIRKADDAGLRIVAYYDSNPNNPLGLVRGKAETLAIGTILQNLSTVYRDRDAALIAQTTRDNPMIDLGPMQMRAGSGYRWDGPASRVRMIDDMVYDGLVYPGSEQPFAFAQHPDFTHDAATFFGLSKVGLANLRAGVIVASERDFEGLRKMLMLDQYFPSKPALHALEGYFNAAAPETARRERHLARLNDNHRIRGILMKALINGIDTMPEATPADRRRVETMTMAHYCCDRDAARIKLNAALTGVRVVTTPQAGFFHLLDFSALKGRVYKEEYPAHWQRDAWSVVDGDDAIRDMLNRDDVNIHMAAGNWDDDPRAAMMARVTFALPPADIFDMVDRLRTGLRIFRTASPDCVPAPAGLSI